MATESVLEPAARVKISVPLSITERLAMYFSAGRLRLLAKRYRRGLQREFVHNRLTCEYWAVSLARLTRAAGVLKGWTDRSSPTDRSHFENLRRYLDDAGAALPGLTRVQPHPDAQAHDEAAVWAIARAYKSVRDACWYLEEWQRELRGDADLGREVAAALLDPSAHALAAEPAPAARRKTPEPVWTLVEVEQLVVASLRKYQQCERLASCLPPPAAPCEDPAVIALQPFLDLCMAGREAFLLEHLLLTLYPAAWHPALGGQFSELHCRAASIMPPGPLRSVSTYRANLHQKYLSSGKPPAEYLRAALNPDYRAGADPSPPPLPKWAADRGTVLVVAAPGHLRQVLELLEGEILPRHAGVSSKVRVIELSPRGDLPESPALPGGVRLIVVDLTTTERRSWAMLLKRLDSSWPYPLPPSTQARLAVVPVGKRLLPGPADQWVAVVPDQAVRELKGWFKPTRAGSPPDALPELPGRPLTTLVDRACILLDSWKVTDRGPRPDPTQIIHPLNQFLQQTKLDLILGTRGPPDGSDSASLGAVCRAAFVAVVASQDNKMGRGKAEGVEVPADFATRLDWLVSVPSHLAPVGVRPGELLAGMILLFTRCLGGWDRPVCRAEVVSGDKVELTVNFRTPALRAYPWSLDRSGNPLAALVAAGLVSPDTTQCGDEATDSVKLVFQTLPRIALLNEATIS